MFFKNLSAYKLTSPINATLEQIESHLKSFSFSPCGTFDAKKSGFAPPIEDGELFTHVISPYVMFCVKTEEKIIPESSVKTAVNERVKIIRKEECRPVGRAERVNMREEFIYNSLPHALSKTTLTYGYIDTISGWVFIDAGTPAKAEDILSKLRDALGSLSCIRLENHVGIALAIKKPTEWLKSHGQDLFEIGCDYSLEHRSGEKTTYKNTHPDSDYVFSCLESGMFVTKLSMHMGDKLSFSIDQNMNIKQLKFSEKLIAENQEKCDIESHADQFDADFSIMTGEISNLIESLVSAYTQN
jgi:recombination associated protein RdgC